MFVSVINLEAMRPFSLLSHLIYPTIWTLLRRDPLLAVMEKIKFLDHLQVTDWIACKDSMTTE